jgi:hypothetical protein
VPGVEVEGCLLQVSTLYCELVWMRGLLHVRVKRPITVRIKCFRVGFSFMFMFIEMDIDQNSDS